MTGRKYLRWLLWTALLLGLGWLVAMDQRRVQAPVLADVPPRHINVPAPAVNAKKVVEVVVRDLIPRERLIAKRRPGVPVTDLFASRSWTPPPAPAPAAPPSVLPPPAAPAPPLFTYLGKRRDEQGWQVYLGRGDLALIVREGETIEGGYRVESIKPPTLTLVRADNKQQIAIGEWE